MEKSMAASPNLTEQRLSFGKKRIESIDLLRGVVIIIMALDHVRDYFHADYFLFSPTDLTKTSAALFFTRWITNFCAPTFVFLAGTSAFLMGQRKLKSELSLFLFTRGLWLVFLELTVVNFAWFFNPLVPFFRLQTIWSLGISMIALSGLIYLPKKIILAIGLIILFLHNNMDNIHATGNGLRSFIWGAVHERRNFIFFGHTIRTGYPVLAWIGIMALGYCFGGFYRKEVNPEKRKMILLIVGLSAIATFVSLRAINIYGDKSPWSSYTYSTTTLLSFLNVTKYPPSLLYSLMTLGPCIIFLALAEKPLGKLGLAISAVGRVPLFFYIIHLYLIHLAAILAIELSGGSWRNMIFPANDSPLLKGYGFSLGVVYLVWMAIVLLLYPFCKRYDKYKTSHRGKWWLSYL